ncbi:MAG: TolC family protein [Vulcanimicrobiota bacterium]
MPGRLRRAFLWCGAAFLLATVLLPVQASPLLPEEAVRRAVQVDPRLKRARALTEAAEAYSRGAGAQPNPVLQISGVAGDTREDANSLTQPLEIAGQPRLRREIADKTALANSAFEKAVRQEVALEAAKAYYNYWQAVEFMRLSKSQLELAGKLLDIASQRLRLGEISESELFRARLLHTQTELALVEAEEGLLLSQQSLNLLLSNENGVPELPSFTGDVPMAPPFPLETSSGDFSQLEQQISERPELKESLSKASVAKLEADLAGRAGAPDLRFTAYRSSLGHGAVQGLQVSVVIPLFDWGRLGAAHARQKKLAEARVHEISIVRRELQNELQTALTKYKVAAKKREALIDQVSRQVELVQLAQRGYEIGLISLFEVIDAQDANLRARQAFIDAEADYQRARVQLWWAAGLPLSPENSDEDAKKGIFIP